MLIVKYFLKELLLYTKLSSLILKILEVIPYCLKELVCKKVILTLQKLEDEKKLLVNGYSYKSSGNGTVINTNKVKIAYILNNSLPFFSNGYAIRSHNILKAVQKIDLDMCAVTRVGFPWDIDEKIEIENMKNIYDNISYFRLDKVGFRLHDTAPSKYIDNYSKMLISFMRDEDISMVHGASDYLTGLAAVGAAKALSIPSIYEVRGFWEITRSSRESLFKHTVSFKMMKKLDIQACKDSTNVIAISEVIKEELILRGIDEDKIYVLPNGVDTKIMKPLEKDALLLKKVKLEDKFVIGFIGSVVDYEGLSLLIDSAQELESLHVDTFRYLVVGDGSELSNLKKQVKQKSLEHLFVFMGRIPYEEVEKYYSIIDVVCYPRLDWEVCRIVSPKKPFEAMAYGIPVISSSVRANSYFIQDGDNGLIHKAEDSDDLTSKILSIYSDEGLRQRLSKGGREWVVANRDSSKTGLLLKKIYQETQEKFYR